MLDHARSSLVVSGYAVTRLRGYAVTRTQKVRQNACIKEIPQLNLLVGGSLMHQLKLSMVKLSLIQIVCAAVTVLQTLTKSWLSAGQVFQHRQTNR